jgi:septum formation protein
MLVLASQSPSRKEILQNAGIEAVVRVSGVPEERLPHETAVAYVRRLARMKAEAIERSAEEIVLGADTVVVLGEDILEKPRDAAHATEMLTMLSGRSHSVITGICLRHSNGLLVDHAETIVQFESLSAEEIRVYAASGEPLDKAGAYAIQGLASKFITRIDGCYFNVVGLPVAMVYRRLKELCGNQF